MTTHSPAFEQALALARRLSVRDQLRLIALIAEELAGAIAPTAADVTLPMPTGGTSADNLPLNRKDIYGDGEHE